MMNPSVVYLLMRMHGMLNGTRSVGERKEGRVKLLVHVVENFVAAVAKGLHCGCIQRTGAQGTRPPPLQGGTGRLQFSGRTGHGADCGRIFCIEFSNKS